MAGPLGLGSPLGSLRGLFWATWRLLLLRFWSAEDRVVLGSIFWESRFPSFVFGHFFLLGALGLIWNGPKFRDPFGPIKSLTTLRLQIVVLKGAKCGNNQLLNSHLYVGKINCSYFIINRISLCCNLL